MVYINSYNGIAYSREDWEAFALGLAAFAAFKLISPMEVLHMLNSFDRIS